MRPTRSEEKEALKEEEEAPLLLARPRS